LHPGSVWPQYLAAAVPGVAGVKVVAYGLLGGGLLLAPAVQEYLLLRRGLEPVHKEAPAAGVTMPFAPAESAPVSGVSLWLRLSGFALIVVGVLRMVAGGRDPRLAVEFLSFLEGFLIALVGLFMQTPASAFKAAQTDEGIDAGLFMHALAVLKAFFLKQALLILGLAALVLIAAVVRFVVSA
jgi:hypothetical protein